MSTFGKFSEDALLALHQRILAHESLVASRAQLPGKVEGMDHDAGDVLAAEAPRAGGLRQGAGPRFKAPVARESRLGLDKLAAQKRAEAGLEPPNKRPKVEVSGREEENGGVFKVPAVPVRREARRVKPEETPSHGGGMSDSAKARLEEYRRNKNKPSTAVAASNERRERGGLGDFQGRANRGSYYDERDRYGRDRQDDRGSRERWRDGRGDDRGDDRRGDRRGDRGRDDWHDRGKSWDAAPTPRTSRPSRDGDGSLRVPNRGWDETPGRPGWGRGKRSWDETPGRKSRPDSPEFEVDAKEWEEEQVRIDRDWYSVDDEGAVVSLLVKLGS